MRIRNLFYLCFCVLLFACGKELPKKDSLIKVEVKNVLVKDIPIEISSFGTLEPLVNINLKSQVSGVITKVLVKEGSFVKKGDLLFQIDDTIFKNNLAMDEATLSSDYDEAKYQSYIIARDQELFKSGSIAKQDYIRLLTDKAELDSKIKSDVAKINLDKANLEYCSIRSPIDGKIGYVFVDVGNVITANSDILANIKDISSLYVIFNIQEAEIFKLEQALKESNDNLKILVSIDRKEIDSKNVLETFEGKLTFINNTVGKDVSSMVLKGVVNNPRNILIPGMFVNVKVILGIDKNATLIPAEAILNDNEFHYFFMVKNGLATKVFAENIQYLDKYCAITVNPPLVDSDQVIVTHLLDISPGDKVSIISKINN